MDTFLAQPWITLKGGAGITIVQSADAWLDLRNYREAVAWLDIKEVSGTTTTIISYQSAPSKDEKLFTTAAALGGAANPLVLGVTTTFMTPDIVTATQLPVARWLRWSALFSVAGDITFRLWIAANKPGRASLNRQPATAR